MEFEACNSCSGDTSNHSRLTANLKWALLFPPYINDESCQLACEADSLSCKRALTEIPDQTKVGKKKKPNIALSRSETNPGCCATLCK